MKLYIIGNGFDLMHGMRTSYSDFKDWLLSIGCIEIVEELQCIYKLQENNEFVLWSDFEKALGEYDVDVALNWDLENMYITENIINNQCIYSPDYILNTQLDNIVNEIFPKWVKQIEISNLPKKELDKGAYYFTFNYTDTLESLYSIPKEQVCHIHGHSVNNEHLTVGHNNYKEPLDYWDDNITFRENNERMQRINNMNNLYKPIPNLIEQANLFFEGLRDVDSIEIIGHSCSEIDIPYFLKIKESCNPKAKWLFNPYSETDIINIRRLKKSLNI